MSLRAQILELTQNPEYKPLDELGLGRQLGLKKSDRRLLGHEVRLLLSSGLLLRIQGDKLASSKKAPPSESTGKIQFRQGGSAYVILDGPRRDPIQIPPEDTGVAFHGDQVAIAINPFVSQRRDRRGSEQTGRVLRVLARARDTIVGHLQKYRKTYYVAPDDPRQIHEVYVDDPSESKLHPRPESGDKVVVKLRDWKARHQRIEGEIIERLGKTFEPRAELEGIYRKFNLPKHFPVEVDREAAALPSHLRPSELLGRLDYRVVPTVTIDPDDAKDFDDALSLEALEQGAVRVGVHIADVSAYVKSGTALDREAQARGNSTYLVGTVVPMLPEKLSNGLCSLVEAEDRLCKAVFLIFDRKGRLTETNFGNTVIRSRKRLTYKQAYALLFEGNLDRIRALPLPPKHQTGSTGRALSSLTDLELVDLQSWVRKLWAIASRLRKDRLANGSLDLDMPETKIYVDEHGYADRLEKVEHDESHQLIEEFMLAANEAIAHLTRAHRLPSLYRVHDEPDEEKLDEFRKYAATFGVECGDLTRREEIVKVLVTLRDHPQGYVLRTQLLRSLKKACYRASPDGHYGLAKRDYTHFTSPIRRYADLIVHRVFDHYLVRHAGHPAGRANAGGPSLAGMTQLGEHLSSTEINSTEAERESVKIKQLEFFEREVSKTPKTVFAATITDVRPNGLFIELVDSMVFGFIAASSLRHDDYAPSSSGSALVGRRTKRRLNLGGVIDVVVSKVDRFKRLIDFELKA